jgi:hypothetical protein
MQKKTLVSAISLLSATVASTAFATPLTMFDTFYNTTAVAARNSIAVVAGTSTSVYYVDDATAGTASDPSRTPPFQQPVELYRSGDWIFNRSNGNFSGNIAYGDYKTQTNTTGTPTTDGRQTFTGVNQYMSNTGTWVTPTHFVWSYFNTVVNGGGASTQTQTSASCVNGVTNILGKVCTSFATASRDWEGVSLDFYFSADHYYFSGTLTAIDTSGSGLSRNTTTIVWFIDGVDPPFPAEVPVPSAAWLFGSGLIGLAAARRRLRKT